MAGQPLPLLIISAPYSTSPPRRSTQTLGDHHGPGHQEFTSQVPKKGSRGTINSRGQEAREETIEALHRQYAGATYYKCLKMLGNPGEAEDAVQETFVKVYLAIDQWDRERSPLPWIYRIATNICLDALRKRRRKGFVLDEGAVQRLRADGARQDDRAHYRNLLDQLMGELDPRGQELVVAHYLDGMSQGEAADSLGISRRAVVKRLTALRKRVGELLVGGGSDE